MEYLKKFINWISNKSDSNTENISINDSSRYYRKITQDEYLSYKKISISQRLFDKVKNIVILNRLSQPIPGFASHLKWDYRESYDPHVSVHFRDNKNKSVSITQCDDEWFPTSISISDDKKVYISYYICDQIDGVFMLMRDEKLIK